MGRKVLLIVVLGMLASPLAAQDRAAEARVAEAERRAAEAERRAAEAERRAATVQAPGMESAKASAGASAAGRDLQRVECQAARRNFELVCSRRALETAWEARECALAAEESRSQCDGPGRP